jgi:hypothetical protein
MSPSMQSLRRAIVAIALCVPGLGLAPSPASARVFVGIGVPFFGPGFYPPPYYYPPPVYYPPPPPVVYAPPPQVYAPPPQVYAPPPQVYAPQRSGQTCYAGAYVCPMDRPVAAGGSCYCLGNGGEHVWGRAN